MSPAEENLKLFKTGLEALGHHLDELVFVGGVTIWFHTDFHEEMRTTKDIDVVIEAGTYETYQNFAEKLLREGWIPGNKKDDPPCRLCKEGLVLDVMAYKNTPLMQSNRWFEAGMKNSIELSIEGVLFKTFTFEYLMLSKFEAFKGRGKSNLPESKDMVDIFNLMARSDFETKLESIQTTRVWNDLENELRALKGRRDFERYLKGHFSPRDHHRAEGILKTLDRYVGI